jgi:type I restriction-modification system DNA methylase subunit
MENLPDGLVHLIDRFKEHLEQYRGVSYDEANTRTDFIDPLFELLGWDVANTASYAEQYREVIREDKVSIEGGTKAPDYCFRIGGVRKFFVEAKKPSVDLRNDPSPAYQLRRYAYSAKLPLSILTDFQEFAVYDTRIKPNPNDSASVARIQYFTFEDFPEKWAFLTGTFSREAILHGAFDKYVEDTRSKRGTSEVDKEFLKLIDQWREKLARNIALRNHSLPLHQLNFVVQKTIDRIVFLRIAEDRGIDTYGNMHTLLNGTNQYTRLLQLFTQADARYNGGLFNFAEDTLTPGLTVDDNIIKDIVRSVYYPQSPYEFSVLDVAILGNIYEQFLGKTIRLTAEHRVKVEEKPEVKKAGGVYYTPRDIVEYIVDHTVGEALHETTPAKVEQLHILDPACGSGSFLLGAYDKLLSWHLDWYAQDTHRAKALKDHRITEPRTGDYRLSIDEKRRILTNNIYGVDIDDQAVEIAKLSLTLRLLEGETSETAELFTRGGRQRLLPKLEANIKCGNSLIGPDFYTDKPESLFVDDDTRYRINAFDWKGTSGFKQVFDTHGGFDIVLGNPPYVRSIHLKEDNVAQWQFCRTHYATAADREWDIYLVFVEKGLSLLRTGGRLGYILPNKFLNSQVGANLRQFIADGQHLERLVHFGALQVFPTATTYTCLLFLNHNGVDQAGIQRFTGPVTSKLAHTPLPEQAPDQWQASTVATSSLTSAPWDFASSDGSVLASLRKWPALESYVDVFQGTGTRADGVFLLKEVARGATSVHAWSEYLQKEVTLEPTFLKPALRGRSIGRYDIADQNLLLLVPYQRVDDKLTLVPEKVLAAKSPMTLAYLRACKPRLDERENGRFKNEQGWHAYGYPRSMNRFDRIKIVLPDVCNRGKCWLEDTPHWLIDSAYGIELLDGCNLDLRYVLGILNSPLLTYFLRETGTALRGGYFRMKTAYLNPFPLRPIDFNNSADKAMHDEMVRLVDQMLALHRQLTTTGTNREKSGLQLQIAALDRAIDLHVYRLYDLSTQEVSDIESVYAS